MLSIGIVVFNLIFNGTKWNACITRTLQGEESEQDDSEDDPEALAAEEAADKERKKAGLPQIDVDTVNSTIATKVMPLSKN